MLDYDTPYMLGKRTFFFFCFMHAWWGFLIGGWLLYATYAVYSGGSFDAWTTQFIADNPDWYLDKWLIAEPLLLLGISFIFVGLLRTYVMYRQYRFTVDEDAFHYREGIFRIKEIRIPYMQISNVDIEQPYHYRFVGLAKVDITLSSSETPFRKKKGGKRHLMPMIDLKRARALSSHIIKHSAGAPTQDDDEYEYEYVEVPASHTPQKHPKQPPAAPQSHITH
jgi:membrane protein YdbS with pleckstrin-like domain